MLCPCGTRLAYAVCCEPLHNESIVALTPEQLMRSRYSAYAFAKIAYIQKTMRGKPAMNFNAQEAQQWAEAVQWHELKIINSSLENPHCGYVEFMATFLENGRRKVLQENSEFHRIEDKWYYVDGILRQTNQLIKKKLPSRNGLCSCGSQKKYKNCHGKSK
jgi:SEC-C motif-containing protein